MGLRVLVVGGVAGGASCAARLRRLDETAEIVVFERGPHVSFANCGLPYHVGDVIREEKNLFLATPALFKARFAIDVRTRHEVLSIDRARTEIEVKDLGSGLVARERYDALVLSPGASPVRPPFPGGDLPGIFTLRTVPDSAAIRAWIERREVKRALVVGAGFIGVEMAENLRHRGMDVTVVELANQVLPPFDPEMAVEMKRRLEENGVTLILGDSLESVKTAGDGLLARLKSGRTVTSGLVILSIGVKPDSELAAACGLELGPRGHIRTDDRMRTSDPRIFAVGDAVEVREAVTGASTAVPLAGPANRQGRIAADVIAGRDSRFRGVQATAVVGAFGMTLAATGASEKYLRRQGRDDFERIWVHPGHHVGYYPGAKPIHLKLVFSRADGRLFGAQAAGEEGVEKRIDVIAAFIQKGGSVFDLEEAELSYAPQFGAAKDPVNMAGFVAANVVRGDHPLADWSTLEADVAAGAALVDVREPAEFARGTIPGAINLPLSILRERAGELPRDREILVFCQAGQRGYYAARFLVQNGFRARNYSGGYGTWTRLAGR